MLSLYFLASLMYMYVERGFYSSHSSSLQLSVIKNTMSGLWFLGVFPDFRILFYKLSSFASEFTWKKRSSHQGKKEVACIVSKHWVSCLWGCGESVSHLHVDQILQDFFTFVKSSFCGSSWDRCFPTKLIPRELHVDAGKPSMNAKVRVWDTVLSHTG